MKRMIAAFGVTLMAVPAAAQVPASAEPLPKKEQVAAFRAAGFALRGTEWRKCDDPGTASYSPGQLRPVGDLNGDGLPEAVVTEESTFCYGMAGSGFSFVSRQKDGWKLMTESIGMANFLSTKGVGGWPDIEIGGPGFCFPVIRWNGREYKVVRHQYQGRACRR